MEMVFCRGCGKQIHETAPACPGCGAPQLVAAAAPGTGASTAKESPPEAVSASWCQKFALIDKAGGPETPNAKNLSFWQRASVNYNVWAFLFGPIYYLVKGMPKRAVTLTALSMVSTIVLAVILEYFNKKFPGLWLVAAVLFGIRANGDYYKKVVRKDNGWW
jgi:hypothetical protein